MVNDLDICRPNCIVNFLESIKYMLDIEGLVFIISVSRDKSNVYKAIRTTSSPKYPDQLQHPLSRDKSNVYKAIRTTSSPKYPDQLQQPLSLQF